jgi:hypothetical protein
MDEHQSLSHTMWDFKYHVVWIPKCRRKILFEQLRRHLFPEGDQPIGGGHKIHSKSSVAKNNLS